MRLQPTEVAAVTKCFRAVDGAGKIFLFGSRTRDDLRGGDIDLAIISDNFDFKKKIDFLTALKAEIGDQKIDVAIFRPTELSTNPFYQAIKDSMIQLA